MKKYRFFCLVIVLILVVLTGCSKLLNGKYDLTLSKCIEDEDVDRMMELLCF